MTRRDVAPFNRDALLMLSRDTAAVGAHKALDPINDLPAHEQVGAVALLFATFRTRFGLDPEELSAIGDKMLRPERFHRKGNAQVEALEAYAGLHKQGHL